MKCDACRGTGLKTDDLLCELCAGSGDAPSLKTQTLVGPNAPQVEVTFDLLEAVPTEQS